MQAVILAGGKGTRLLPFTKVFPKPLVPLGERPILDTILRQLQRSGFTRVTLAVGYMADMIQTYIGNGERYGINIQYVLENQPLGTVGPLAQIPDLDQTFLVMNGDVITNINYKEIFNYHKSVFAITTVGTYQKNFKIDLGIIQCNGGNVIVDYIEKPHQSLQVSMGVYVFQKDVLKYIEPQKSMDFPDLVKKLLANGQAVMSYPFDGYWLDIGNRSDYETAINEFESMKHSLNIE